MAITTEVILPIKGVLGGALEGAERNTRETLNWHAISATPDVIINPVKEQADARSKETINNDGYALGAMHIHRDNIVGNQFKLNAEPDTEVLKVRSKGFDDDWAEEFQAVVESRFNLVGNSHECWLDASRHNTMTGLMRLGIASFLMTGEILASCEWLQDRKRPCSTAVQLINPDRLCNPEGQMDTKYLRRGIVRNRYGEPVSYWIRMRHNSEMFYDDIENIFSWKNVKAEKPWGRKQIIHIIEQLQPDQTRGISDMVAVLKQMRMTRKFNEITLQKAVVNATYAGAIESELPSDTIYGAMGGGVNTGYAELLGQYMTALSSFVDGGKAIAIDGVKIPHLFPGTKLNIKPIGGEGDVGTPFEESLLRHIAAALGISYEQFSRNYTKTNYSSARASMAETWKYMQARKTAVADKFATSIYTLWFEEELNKGNIPMPSGIGSEIFYDPIYKEALLTCSWIGASRGQIDEMKESQSSVLRINSGLSTFQRECANLGEDFRRVFAQRAREQRLMKKYGLDFTGEATKPGANMALNMMRDDEESNNGSDDNGDIDSSDIDNDSASSDASGAMNS